MTTHSKRKLIESLGFHIHPCPGSPDLTGAGLAMQMSGWKQCNNVETCMKSKFKCRERARFFFTTHLFLSVERQQPLCITIRKRPLTGSSLSGQKRVSARLLETAAVKHAMQLKSSKYGAAKTIGLPKKTLDIVHTDRRIAHVYGRILYIYIHMSYILYNLSSITVPCTTYTWHYIIYIAVAYHST